MKPVKVDWCHAGPWLRLQNSKKETMNLHKVLWKTGSAPEEVSVGWENLGSDPRTVRIFPGPEA